MACEDINKTGMVPIMQWGPKRLHTKDMGSKKINVRGVAALIAMGSGEIKHLEAWRAKR